MDGVGHHILGCGVFADDDVAALLVSLEYPDDLVWDVWRGVADGEVSVRGAQS